VALRTASLALLLLLLLEPIITMLGTRAEEPRAIVALDRSESMTLPGLDSARFREARAIVRQLAGTPLRESASFIAFADSTRTFDPALLDSIRFSGGVTSLEGVMAATADSLRVANVRSLVLITDGRSTAGASPLLSAEGLGIPVVVVACGDSVEPPDRAIEDIVVNDIAWIGVPTPVQVRVRATAATAGTASVTLRDDDGVIGTRQITLAAGTSSYAVDFSYTPRREGTVGLTATVERTAGELTERNNTSRAYIRVRSGRQRFLLVAGTPSADVSAIRRALAGDKQIVLTTRIQKPDGSFIEGSLDAGTLAGLDGVITVDFPTAATTDAVLSLLRSKAESGTLSTFAVLGRSVDFARLRRIESALPVTIGTERTGEATAEAQLGVDAARSPILRAPDPTAWRSLPPLFIGSTELFPRPGSEVLATAQPGTGTDQPLIVARSAGSTRSVLVAGYGLYRWELLQEGIRAERGEHPSGVLRSFVSGATGWIASADERKRVRIRSIRQHYAAGETLRLVGSVVDEGTGPIDDAILSVRIEGAGRRETIRLSPAGGGRYEGSLGGLPPGDYSFNGEATQGGTQIGSDGGRFDIGELALEFREPSMNAPTLRELAARTGGRFLTTRQADSIVEAVLRSPTFVERSLETRREHSLRTMPWLLAVVLALLALEWVVRKRYGLR